LTATLTCEVNALGYPKAALFGLCLTLMASNAVAVMQAALRAVGGVSNVDMDGNNTLQIKAIKVVISTFETRPLFVTLPVANALRTLGRSL
jgi:cell division protein FtsX